MDRQSQLLAMWCGPGASALFACRYDLGLSTTAAHRRRQAGAAILCDSSAAPIYPRWSGYLCLSLGFAQATASFIPFFKTGPFAWDGLFSWWPLATEFFTIFIVMTVLTVKAVNNQYRAADRPANTAVAETAAPALHT